MNTPVSSPSSESSSFTLDQAHIRRLYCRKAAGYNKADFLAREIAKRMDERLDYIRLAPSRIVDIGCGTGADLVRLAERYPDAFIGGVDFALPMLAEARKRQPFFSPQSRLNRLLRRTSPPPLVCASITALPFTHHSINLIWSNLTLPALDDPLPAFKEMHRCLTIGGLLMFSTFGPDTLKELRATLPDQHGERVHRFIDMHDLGDSLIKAGFSDPVMDMEILTLTYKDLGDLLNDLRSSGGSNASRARPRGLTGKSNWATAHKAYEALRTHDRLPATFEIIQGHAWKNAPKTSEDGRSIIRFQANRQNPR